MVDTIGMGIYSADWWAGGLVLFSLVFIEIRFELPGALQRIIAVASNGMVIASVTLTKNKIKLNGS
jgi:hypothetical protein